MLDSISKLLGTLIFIAVIVLACNDKDIVQVDRIEPIVADKANQDTISDITEQGENRSLQSSF